MQSTFLLEREGSSCHFAEERIYGDHLLCLRIDWRDLELGEPTLDADIYEYRDGKRGRRLPNRQWHHTKLRAQSGGLTNVYTFTFRDLTLELIARKSLAVSASLDAYIVDPNAEGPAAT